MTPLAAALAALRFRAEGGTDMVGEGRAYLIRQLASDTTPPGAKERAEAEHVLGQIAAWDGEGEMHPDLVALASDVVMFRVGVASRAKAWKAVGITEGAGRDMTRQRFGLPAWPNWLALRQAALQWVPEVGGGE